MLQIDPRICKVLYYGNQQGMGSTAVKVAALLMSGMRVFFFNRNADQQTKDKADKFKAQLTKPQVSQLPNLSCLFMG